MAEETTSAGRRIRAAAVQLEAALGDVAANLERLEKLVDEAAAKGARLIALPEFCTSRLPFDGAAHAAVLPPDNPALALLKRLAARHRCWLGGSMLVAEGGEVYNRYHFVEPEGRVHRHDKDLPTMWENAFYGPGRDDGCFVTGLGGFWLRCLLRGGARGGKRGAGQRRHRHGDGLGGDGAARLRHQRRGPGKLRRQDGQAREVEAAGGLRLGVLHGADGKACRKKCRDGDVDRTSHVLERSAPVQSRPVKLR